MEYKYLYSFHKGNLKNQSRPYRLRQGEVGRILCSFIHFFPTQNSAWSKIKRVLHLDYIQKQPVGLLPKRIQEWTKLHLEWTKESDPWEQSHLTRKTHFQSPVSHASSRVCKNGIGLFAQTEAPVKFKILLLL